MRETQQMKKDLDEARRRARKVLQATEKALKRHIGLIKKREKITSVVATLEELRADIRDGSLKTLRRHMVKLNRLTAGFADHVLTGRRKKSRRRT